MYNVHIRKLNNLGVVQGCTTGDYIPEKLKQFKNQVNDIYLVDKRTSSLTLWTDRGASRHCKILDTDKAWEQFDNLDVQNINIRKLNKQKKWVTHLLPIIFLIF